MPSVAAVKFLWDCCLETLDRAKVEEGSGCILAHCMGLGKTLSVGHQGARSSRRLNWGTLRSGSRGVAGSTGARSGRGHVGSQGQLGHALIWVTWGRRVNWGTLRSGSRGVAGSTGARSGRGHVGSQGQLGHTPVGVTWGRRVNWGTLRSGSRGVASCFDDVPFYRTIVVWLAAGLMHCVITALLGNECIERSVKAFTLCTVLL